MADRGSYHVLLVCTANLCRSPMAEHLLRHALSQKWGPGVDKWHVSSAGVAAEPGRLIHPWAAAVLADRGIDSTSFRSRRLTAADLTDANLVLTATRVHRGIAIRLNPAVLGHIYTIKQLGHLLSAAAPQGPEDLVVAGDHLVPQAERNRMIVPARTDEDDLADPVGRSISKFRACAKELTRSIEQIVRPLSTGSRDAAR